MLPLNHCKLAISQILHFSDSFFFPHCINLGTLCGWAAMFRHPISYRPRMTRPWPAPDEVLRGRETTHHGNWQLHDPDVVVRQSDSLKSALELGHFSRGGGGDRTYVALGSTGKKSGYNLTRLPTWPAYPSSTVVHGTQPAEHHHGGPGENQKRNIFSPLRPPPPSGAHGSHNFHCFFPLLPSPSSLLCLISPSFLLSFSLLQPRQFISWRGAKHNMSQLPLIY